MSGIGQVSGRADINQVLAEMRNLKAQVQRPEALQEPSPTSVTSVKPVDGEQNFGSLLSRAVDSVNETQQNASALRTAYEQGDPTVDITRVMIEAQKSTVSFQALTQVRNKVVQAYEDIMKMPI
ncbi:flagellar hook-basal body complex protein FliE [Alkalimarinus sediminis]|uniref:Flagellar hook-basal body complex protein FliE n=1 Tax=Alkalimarinus sediminis TaxID=1632866 RepID=A0A9E8KL07_9ALTE|nr:flagellar hook-basal body complex protein FliE [Alkalimarinus sediminis]UZW76761.1 flagellar hook-basal body complex protein FliE [Alkalimarinus sediminis]